MAEPTFTAPETDAIEAIRKALESGPTPGPWAIHRASSTSVCVPQGRVVAACGGYSNNSTDPGALERELHATTAFIAACHPEAIRALLLQLEEAQRDAARYQWLREQHWHKAHLFVVAGGKSSVRLGVDCPSLARLDEAIDSAILAQQGGKHAD